MKSYHVVGIGNAIVDVFTQADDRFIQMMGIEKGIMQLVERERGETKIIERDVGNSPPGTGGLTKSVPFAAMDRA